MGSLKHLAALFCVSAAAFVGCSDDVDPPTVVTDKAQLDPPPQGQGFQLETETTEVGPGVE